MTSIVQDWVTTLGLRHQGALMAAVRGCDSAHREDPSKWMVRFYRGCIMNAHVGDVRKAQTFMVWCDDLEEFKEKCSDVVRNSDHYPLHFILHFLHAAQICSYYHPDARVATMWGLFYTKMVKKMHLKQETKAEMDKRLTPDEDTFKSQQE